MRITMTMHKNLSTFNSWTGMSIVWRSIALLTTLRSWKSNGQSFSVHTKHQGTGWLTTSCYPLLWLISPSRTLSKHCLITCSPHHLRWCNNTTSLPVLQRKRVGYSLCHKTQEVFRTSTYICLPVRVHLVPATVMLLAIAVAVAVAVQCTCVNSILYWLKCVQSTRSLLGSERSPVGKHMCHIK